MASETGPSGWRAQGGLAFEAEAWDVIESRQNLAVLAGPGAGKTEILAQRACFLVQRHLCRWPYKILALSFKRDAASNLQERVRRRAGAALSQSFASLTYHAFAKQMLDQFRTALPELWRPTAHFQVVTDPKVLRGFPQGRGPLPLKPEEHQEHRCWHACLHGGEQSQLSFDMMQLLVELLVRTNERVRLAHVSAYRFVMLDEFQDTTDIQYALLRTIFGEADTVLTAVGDPYQRIMGWAHALPDALQQYQAEYGARQVPLLVNYRSVPDLVAIQKVLLRETLHAETPDVTAHRNAEETIERAAVWSYESADIEAECVTAQIRRWLAQGVEPRSIGVLVKLRPEEVTADLRTHLLAAGIDCRVEDRYQDLLAEPLVRLIVDSLSLIVSTPLAPELSRLRQTVCQIRGLDDEINARAVGEHVRDLLKVVADHVERESPERSSRLVTAVLDAVGRKEYIAAHPRYRNAAELDFWLAEFGELFGDAGEGRDWPGALAYFRGLGAVPILTIHKAKGLEFDRVAILGLEDCMMVGNPRYWDRADPRETALVFFVAFSRAINQVVMTHCRTRVVDLYWNAPDTSVDHVRFLYNALKLAAVPCRRTTVNEPARG